VVGVLRDPSPSYGLVPKSGSCLYVLRFMSTFTIPVFLFSPECVAKGRLLSDLLFGWGEVGRSLSCPDAGGWVSRRCRSNYNKKIMCSKPPVHVDDTFTKCFCWNQQHDISKRSG
jgi:hypothetical protein